MAELNVVPARDLDKFIHDYLMVNTPFRKQVKEAIHIVSSFLKERCFTDEPHRMEVSKVVKGGSSGKGTALRGRSDADLVIFLNNFTSFEDQFEQRGEVIKEIRSRLKAYHREGKFDVKFEDQDPSHKNPRALSFSLRSREHNWLPKEVEFDVLPAFDVLGQWKGGRPDPEVYVQLIQVSQKLGREGEFSPCFTELQRAFLKQRTPKLKSLIRLVKHWFQKCKEKLEKPLPAQYALELLTVYTWERGGGRKDFVTAEGFRAVLELILNYRQLCIFWRKYYLKNPTVRGYLQKQLKKPRPVILDPADPTGNVAGEDLCAWARLAEEAHTWLSYPCCRNSDGSPVKAWNVPPNRRVRGRKTRKM
ncbi:2'-5'-oligoadenylate synthase 1-like [Erinaceus europaeus]|uniref:2'-5' oligoadenylate synthase n=1 Tax=Erinaceus europaeus TaxID=9365 RepID=A0A1S3A583_ERIEU|nr:2'-5'-oligoadenylate synthase 1-like [Erinaceus europaeus]